MPYKIFLSALLFLLFSTITIGEKVVEKVILNDQFIELDTLPVYFNHSLPECSDNDTLYSSSIMLSPIFDYPFFGQLWPGCSGGSLDNPRWINFVANGYEARFNIEVPVCLDKSGVQIAVYELPMDLSYSADSPGINPVILVDDIVSDCSIVQCMLGIIEFTVQTKPGRFYGVVLDGCRADECEVEMTILSDSNHLSLDGIQVDTIYYPRTYSWNKDSICLGALDIPFFIDSIEHADYTLWKFNDSLINSSQLSDTLYLDFVDTGIQEVCVAVANICDTSEYRCLSLTVLPVDTLIIYDTICQGDEYIWLGNLGELLEQIGPFNDETGDFEYTSSSSNIYSCDQPMKLKLHVRNENEDQPTIVDTFTCFANLPFLFQGETFDRPVDSQIISSISPTSNCDTFFNLNLIVFGGLYTLNSSCDGQQNIIFSFDPIDLVQYTPWEDQLKIFTEKDDFRLDAIWYANNIMLDSGGLLNYSINYSELDSLSSGEFVEIELKLKMYFDSTLFCTYSSPPYSYDLRNELPKINTKVSLIDDSLLIVEDSASLYQWVNCDSNYTSINGANMRIFQPMDKGNYAVILQKGACTDTSDCFYYNTTSTNEWSQNSQLDIVPNPNSGRFTLSNVPFNWEKQPYRIFNMQGLLIKTGYYEHSAGIDISLFPPGIYYLQIKNNVLKILRN